MASVRVFNVFIRQLNAKTNFSVFAFSVSSKHSSKCNVSNIVPEGNDRTFASTLLRPVFAYSSLPLHAHTFATMSSIERVVDLRSDTLTAPTDAMRKAMAEAEVGDDVHREDPTVNRLQSLAAELCGKEDALFVPTGTMGNLLCVFGHCFERGSEVMLGNSSHLYLREQGGVAQWGGVYMNALPNRKDGTFSLDDVRSKFHDGKDFHESKTSLIAIENTMNGRILPMDFIKELRQLANELNVPIHMDGARLLNAAVGLNVPVSSITQYVDSVSICLSKSLGAPVGSVIVGSKQFIARTRRIRTALGGAMRQSGVIAAAGILALTDMVKRLHIDHENAKTFAKGIIQYSPQYINFDVDEIETNMVWFDVNTKLPTYEGRNPAQEFCYRMANRYNDDDVVVKMSKFFGVSVRCVFYNGVSQAHVKLALEKFHSVMKAWISESNF